MRSWLRGFGRFLTVRLYTKVRSYLLGGTAAAGLSGGLLWLLTQFNIDVSPGIAGLVPAGAAILVGLYVAYETQERHPAVVAAPAGKAPADVEAP